ADIRHIDELAVHNDFEDWINRQFEVPATLYLETLKDIYTVVYNNYVNEGGDPNDFRCRPKWYHANYAWWEMIVTGEDMLRQRIALALSEILVISKANSDLENYGYAVASYYDIFLKHAFGNYHDILMEVTLHPAMGNYLSHLNNPKSNPAEFTFPDENYGREFMQLFTIGIHELNNDGSKKKDSFGNPIATYDNEEITGISSVFTGLGAGATSECENAFAPAFGLDIRKIDMTVPMKIYEAWHQAGEKKIISGTVIPAGQTGLKDIEDAVTTVFNHPNVGPFISYRLLQHLIKSNPSPGYVERVASAFNDNGQGTRGDMKAVIKAILLDPEARTCESMLETSHGKLREPILRYTHLARAMDKYSPSGYFWNTGDDFYHSTGQHPLDAPSVFNFFQPTFQPNGPLANAGLVGPEFQLLNSISGLEYFDVVNEWTVYEVLFQHRETGSNREVYLDTYNILGGARDPEVLINSLDVLLTHGQLTHRSRELLRKVLYDYRDEGIELFIERTWLALYFFMVSPDYSIFK
ncbi:MAG: DUF1800 domain-containing protein, partial [Saprospiraceae bacterium]|nr:DUF1800 domain-containing protein [Saprospiraceae bacterium]